MKKVRFFDLSLACLLITIFSFPMFLIGILINATSKGGALYKQLRVGYKENFFYIYKFRTMEMGSDSTGTITVGNDKRITKIGKILRKTKLDELPQLINVIKGEMSFVGPRPDTPKYTEYYKEYNEKYFEMMPGITGKASIYLVNEEELMKEIENPELFYIKEIIPKKVELNNYHLEHFNILVNIKVIFETIWKILK